MRFRQVVPVLAMLLAIGITIGLLLGFAHERTARVEALRTHPPPGHMVSVGHHALHLDCRGEGSPVLLLEAGMDPFGSISWRLIHESLAEITRVCAYDRAGIAWSEYAEGHRSWREIVEELHTLLSVASIDLPIVLAGHSMGGSYALSFAAHYPEELAGLVLIESSHPDMFEKLPAISDTPPRWMLSAMAAMRPFGIARLLMQSELEVKALAVKDRDALKAVSGSSMGTVAREFQSIEQSLENVRNIESLGTLPVLVISVGGAPDASRIPDFSQEQADAAWKIWTGLHRDLAALSNRSEHELIPGGSHYLQFSQPERLVESIVSWWNRMDFQATIPSPR